MSDEQKYNATIKEIRDIYLFLAEQEPTPDDEIEARDKLIDKFKFLSELDISANKKPLIKETLDQLENWDTLELWFKEVDGLAENIKKTIDAKNVAGKENKPKELNSEGISNDSEQQSAAPQIDITQIVAQVSDQFKGEISTLKSQIDLLQQELKKKEQALKVKEIKKPEEKKSSTRAPKKKVVTKSKLGPIEIKIPTIKQPKPQPKQQSKISASKTKPKAEPVVADKPKIQPVVADKPKIQPVVADKPKIQPVVADKPKIQPVVADKPKIQPVVADKPKIQPVVADKPKIQPVVADKPKIQPVVADKPKIQPVGAEKPKITPFTAEMPKISPVTVEKVEPVSVKTSGTDLFNVFSSVGEKAPGSPIAAVEPVGVKGKKSPKKRKRGDRPGITATAPSFAGFGAPEPDVDSEDFMDIDSLPADKDSLYQELIALEGRRYSLEKNYKELETSYQKGSIDDFEYKGKSDELKYKLNEITERINNIRRVISSL
ncbi:MAG: hypothetical protein ACTSR8_03485 [Promethearchaeota archaeon]